MQKNKKATKSEIIAGLISSLIFTILVIWGFTGSVNPLHLTWYQWLLLIPIYFNSAIAKTYQTQLKELMK